jgi:hypothetical protein
MKLKQLLTVALFVAALIPNVASAAFFQINKPTQIETEKAYFLNLGHITLNNVKQANQELENFFLRIANEDELECTVKVKGKITVGVAEFEVEVSVTGPCGEVRQQALEFLNLMSGIQSVIDKLRGLF